MRYSPYLFTIFFCVLIPLSVARAEIITLSLHDAIKRAHNFDPRIAEKEKLIGVARGQLQEAEGSLSWIYDFNAFVGLAPQVRGQFFDSDGDFDRSSLDFDGVSPWYNLDFTIIRPLLTFGKVKQYSKAARNNITIKEMDVELQRAEVYIDVVRAYYGYLTARDIDSFLHNVRGKVNGALQFVNDALAEGEGTVKQSDVHALKTGIALVNRFIAEAKATQNIAMDGIRLITGLTKFDTLELADQHVSALPLPEESLEQLQAKALLNRPEMKQVEAGLTARRALVAATNAEYNPNIYGGLGGTFSYAPEREPTSDFSVYDPFNHYGVTPVLGVKWDLYAGVQRARTTQEQAQLDALIEKQAFAQLGIPFEVAQQYYQVHSYHTMIAELKDGALAGRRWMTTAYADFEAGLENSALTLTALQAYVAAYADYLRAINDYNVHVARLWVATGELK